MPNRSLLSPFIRFNAGISLTRKNANRLVATHVKSYSSSPIASAATATPTSTENQQVSGVLMFLLL